MTTVTKKIPLSNGKTVLMLDLTADKVCWRIEHPTRGTYLGFDYAEISGKYRPRFSTVGTRSADNVWVTHDPKHALSEIERVIEHEDKAYLLKMWRK